MLLVSSWAVLSGGWLIRFRRGDVVVVVDVFVVVVRRRCYCSSPVGAVCLLVVLFASC